METEISPEFQIKITYTPSDGRKQIVRNSVRRLLFWSHKYHSVR